MIIANNIGGLSNRIKCLASCLHIDNEVKILWQKKPWMVCDFFDLFDMKIEITNIPQGSNTYDSWRLLLKKEDYIPENFCIVTKKDNNIIDFSDADPKGRNIDFEYERIPQKIKNAYSETFKKIKIQDFILEKSEIFTNFLEKDAIGIHIRSWDSFADDARRKKYVNLQFFFEEIEKADLYRKIFLTSDSEEIIKLFKEKYKNKIITYDRKTPLKNSRNDILGTKEDLIELLILSKMKHIIGTYVSTYTEVAWWLGGANAKITIY